MEHLPECPYVEDHVQYEWKYCVCDELRACEQRVRTEGLYEINNGTEEMFKAGYAAALRDAIGAMDAVDAKYEVNPDWMLWESRKAIEALKEKP